MSIPISIPFIQKVGIRGRSNRNSMPRSDANFLTPARPRALARSSAMTLAKIEALPTLSLTQSPVARVRPFADNAGVQAVTTHNNRVITAGQPRGRAPFDGKWEGLLWGMTGHQFS